MSVLPAPRGPRWLNSRWWIVPDVAAAALVAWGAVTFDGWARRLALAGLALLITGWIVVPLLGRFLWGRIEAQAWALAAASADPILVMRFVQMFASAPRATCREVEKWALSGRPEDDAPPVVREFLAALHTPPPHEP